MIMDKIDGWNVEGFEGVDRHEGSQVGGRLAACMWIFSKKNICHGQRHTDTFLDQKIFN